MDLRHEGGKEMSCRHKETVFAAVRSALGGIVGSMENEIKVWSLEEEEYEAMKLFLVV